MNSSTIAIIVAVWGALKLVEIGMRMYKKKLEKDIDQLTEQLIRDIRDEHKRHFER